MKNLATSTIHVWLSMTTRPPEPIIAPILLRLSKSRGRSKCSFVRQAPLGPPICTALNSPSPLIPPPISKIIFLSVVPIGTSIRPVFVIFPVRAKAFVPGLLAVPIERYQSAPFPIIWETVAKVSTLLRTVGESKRPCSVVRGGLTRGKPLLPSMLAVRAEPSPHTKAPAPFAICILNDLPEPRISSPRIPILSASMIAFCNLFTANGYSALT